MGAPRLVIPFLMPLALFATAAPVQTVHLMLEETYQGLPVRALEQARELARDLLAAAGYQIVTDSGASASLDLKASGVVRGETYRPDRETSILSVGLSGSLTFEQGGRRRTQSFSGSAIAEEGSRSKQEWYGEAYAEAYRECDWPEAFSRLLFEGEKERVLYLVEVMHLHDPRLQAAAVAAIGRSPEAAAAFPALLADLRRESAPVEAICRVLLERRPPGLVAALLGALEQGVPKHRPQIVRTLVSFPEPAVAAALAARLADRELALVAEDSLGKLGRAAVPAALSVLAHEQWVVRASAARLLGGARATEALEPLLGLLAKDPERVVRTMAAQALGRLDDLRAVPALGEAAARDGNEYVRAHALESLGGMEAWAGAPVLVAGAADQSKMVRESAVKALETLSGLELGDAASRWKSWWEEERRRPAPPAPAARAATTTIDLGGKVLLELVEVPAGAFEMGAAPNEHGRSRDDGPRHTVTLRAPFYIARTEVTREQFRAVAGTAPAGGAAERANLPVRNVTWSEAAQFCAALSAGTGKRFRLPTEAEWEYACRAGAGGRPVFYFHERALDYAWLAANSNDGPQPVGLKKPNPFGLHDVYGNVAEWCGDRFGPYAGGAQTDPPGPQSGTMRVVRGGSYASWSVRSAERYGQPEGSRWPHIGFRVVME